MTKFTRRSFLGAAGAGLAASMTSVRAMALPSAPWNTSDRLITIYLRGAQDGVSTVVPIGDTTYAAARGAIAATPAQTVALAGTSYAALHQNYSVLTGSNSPDANGHAAWIHQVGSPPATRSHFEAQAQTESCDLTSPSALGSEGFVPRLRERASPMPPGPALWGASISNKMQQMFRSTDPNRIMAHVKTMSAYQFGMPGFDPVASRQRTATTLALTQTPTKPLAAYLDAIAEFANISEAQIQAAANYTHDPARFPRNQAEAIAAGLPITNPQYGFMLRCEEALQIAMNTTCQVVGVEIGGWDTHQNQVLRRDELDPWLALAIRSLYDLTVGLADDYTILVITEFGRTNLVNVNAGSDHGVGGLMMLFGRKVVGGVYNCYDPLGTGLGVAPWVPLGSGTGFNHSNAQNDATDFRTVYAELLQKRFALNAADLDVIIPGWSAIAGTTPATTYLGCVL